MGRADGAYGVYEGFGWLNLSRPRLRKLPAQLRSVPVLAWVVAAVTPSSVALLEPKIENEIVDRSYHLLVSAPCSSPKMSLHQRLRSK